MTVALSGLGDTEGAIRWLQAAYAQRHPDLVEMSVDRRYDSLRPDPRFQEVLQGVGYQP